MTKDKSKEVKKYLTCCDCNIEWEEYNLDAEEICPICLSIEVINDNDKNN